MKIKSMIADHFDQDGIWQIEGKDYYCYRREEEEFDRLLGGQRSGQLIEIGAGRGRYAIRYASDFDRVITVDISNKMLWRIKNETVRLKINNIYSFQSDAEKLSFHDNSFDVALAPQVIGHCPRPESMLLEMSRVLKSGGRGIISTANYLSLPGLKQIDSIINCFFKNGLFIKNLHEYRLEGREFWLKHQKFVRDSIFSLSHFLRKAGFKVDKVSGSGIFPTFLSKRLKFLEDKSFLFPIRYFCRTIIITFIKE